MRRRAPSTYIKAVKLLVKLSGIMYESFADADGVSTVLFVSGCRHGCKGCHSPQTHDFNYGVEVTDNLINEINDEIDKRPFLNALVLSGGDPMYSASEILKILPKIHVPNGNIWCYSGFTMEEIAADSDMSELLGRCSCLIDGPFDLSKRNVALKFRGSLNQRLWRKINGIWTEDNN